METYPLVTSRPPTFQEWSDKIGITVPQLKKQIRRSHRAKAALIEANLRLVVTVARQTVKQQREIPINFQDACQEGMIGLSIACEKFDPEKGEYQSVIHVIVFFFQFISIYLQHLLPHLHLIPHLYLK
jgi:hypothetical protein